MSKRKIAACLSSKSVEWATPKDFFDRLNEEFQFNLDPCSTHENAKCEKHYTIQEDGLSQDWGGGGEFSAIRLTEKKYPIGSRNATSRVKNQTLSLLCSSRHGQIRHISTIISMGKQKRYGSSGVDYILTMKKQARHSPRWS